MTPEQLAKMQAGRQAAAEARRAEQERLDTDEQALWESRHRQAQIDLRAARLSRDPNWYQGD